jgi:rhodanese-related sulfurtransferase
MAPFDLTTLGGFAYALVFAAIGFGFGAVLELAGFGDTRKLAAQFYLRDMTVLKTMFTAIVVAALLIFLATSFGLLDLGRVWVNPTYLWPGIAGGLIMGVGFVVGGFCPGTSLVAAATLKLDGILFVAGALFGVYLFGESVGSFEPFWLSSHLGKFTLPEWLGLSTGTTLLLVVAMAIAMFATAEWIESRFRPAAPEGAAPPPARRGRVLRRAGAVALVAGALVAAAHGQPGADERLRRSPALQRLVDERTLFVHPAEVVALRNDLTLEVDVLDLRTEHDFNLFHLGGARRVDPSALESVDELKHLQNRPRSVVTFLVSNGEAAALSAWKSLVTLGVPNLYVIEGGVNRWLELYPVPACVGERTTNAGDDELGWRLSYATGASLPSARPELVTSHELRAPCEDGPAPQSPGTAEHGARWPVYAFTKRVKLQTKAAVKGGCG